MSKFSHIDDKGRVRMVDVTAKKPTKRTAVAGGMISMNSETFDLIENQKVKKGNVLETARIRGTHPHVPPLEYYPYPGGLFTECRCKLHWH
jgi:molybdenum cofactor biosynthesis enzyme